MSSFSSLDARFPSHTRAFASFVVQPARPVLAISAPSRVRCSSLNKVCTVHVACARSVVLVVDSAAEAGCPPRLDRDRTLMIESSRSYIESRSTRPDSQLVANRVEREKERECVYVCTWRGRLRIERVLDRVENVRDGSFELIDQAAFASVVAEQEGEVSFRFGDGTDRGRRCRCRCRCRCRRRGAESTG